MARRTPWNTCRRSPPPWTRRTRCSSRRWVNGFVTLCFLLSLYFLYRVSLLSNWPRSSWRSCLTAAASTTCSSIRWRAGVVTSCLSSEFSISLQVPRYDLDSQFLNYWSDEINDLSLDRSGVVEVGESCCIINNCLFYFLLFGLCDDVISNRIYILGENRLGVLRHKYLLLQVYLVQEAEIAIRSQGVFEGSSQGGLQGGTDGEGGCACKDLINDTIKENAKYNQFRIDSKNLGVSFSPGSQTEVVEIRRSIRKTKKSVRERNSWFDLFPCVRVYLFQIGC